MYMLQKIICICLCAIVSENADPKDYTIKMLCAKCGKECIYVMLNLHNFITIFK